MPSSRIAAAFGSPRPATPAGQPAFTGQPALTAQPALAASTIAAGADDVVADTDSAWSSTVDFGPGPDERPPSRWNWDVGAVGIRALAAFAVVVATIAAVLAWQARPDVEPLIPPQAPGALTESMTVVPTGVVVVAVSGRVRRPGLVRLPAGARVADAIEAAGGVLPGTDLAMINLARKVTDGELIVVGVTAPPGVSAQPDVGAGSGQVNLNTATAEQLQTLPGVGPVLAARIIDYRNQQGGFTSVSDLRKVTGIGDARFNELKDRVTV